ncbi:DUF1361 domain-containing protein [Candidatus Enterococcus ferrettii]|uniref:DUF1361 domain-containing protein n=1 Tax=Candidatus Enterococcus ferrettii TaxID=2815324 RepID=A0ABV0EVC5_9ENTE|nr:DUF1361 domain-containing protein [Enterococcus sp. 665A]MBO1342049.1 DUF1361 domain-containing protein [Enterococcus sp. 665A]
MKVMLSKPAIYRLVILAYMIAMTVFANPFSFMSLNIFLAWLPIEFGNLVIRMHTKWKYFLGGFWLLFFPNIPYLLTDLLHLEVLNIYQSGGLFQNIPKDWLLFLLLVLPILIMVTVGTSQAMQVINQLSNGKKYFWFYLTILAALTAIAIYIGRFDRIHSVDLIIHPLSTLNLLLGNWGTGKLQFVLVFMIIQLVIWLLLKEVIQSKKED